MELRNQKIWIISPQAWGKMKLSKHHYASELAKRGNEVYFFNSSSPDYPRSPVVSETEEENLFMVNYRNLFPFRIRFYNRPVFDWMMQFQVKKLIQGMGHKPNIVWCFDYNLFSRLRYFQADFSIYHPVDPVIYPFHKAPAQDADIVMSVSQKILSCFDAYKAPKHFVNHGLSRPFEEIARKRLAQNDFARKAGPKKVGYVGNLMRAPIDRPIFLQMIEENPAVEFHIWGPTSTSGNNLAGETDTETLAFLDKLKAHSQVKMRGVRLPEVLSIEMQEMDAFILSYRYLHGYSDRSNSHKLLEYISTGKTVVSSLIDTYADEDKRYLLEMPDEDHDGPLPGLLSKVLANLEQYNSAALQRERIEFALDNTYSKQIERIQTIIQAHLGAEKNPAHIASTY